MQSDVAPTALTYLFRCKRGGRRDQETQRSGLCPQGTRFWATSRQDVSQAQQGKLYRAMHAQTTPHTARCTHRARCAGIFCGGIGTGHVKALAAAGRDQTDEGHVQMCYPGHAEPIPGRKQTAASDQERACPTPAQTHHLVQAVRPEVPISEPAGHWVHVLLQHMGEGNMVWAKNQASICCLSTACMISAAIELLPLTRC